MQTLTEIRKMLREAGLGPRRRFGQNFLIDHNLMARLLEMAELPEGQTVLEVGPATGSLTEELIERAARVVAVEIDRGLAELLRDRLAGRENFELIEADVLASKHALNPVVLRALGPAAHVVANLPYGIASPFVAQCLVDAWRVEHGRQQGLCLFERLTFTVQRELGERFSAGPGSGNYCPLSVLTALLARITLGPTVPPSAFWPRPRVSSRIMRIDFDREAAGRVRSIDTLTGLVSTAFMHRRKQIGSILRGSRGEPPMPRLAEALETAGVQKKMRAEQVRPSQFLLMSEILSEGP